MSKVDRSHRSLTSKATTRRTLKVNSDITDVPKVIFPDEAPSPWEEQARPSGSEQAQNADFIVEVCANFLCTCHPSMPAAQLDTKPLEWLLIRLRIELGCRMRGQLRPWSLQCLAWSSPTLSKQGTLSCLLPRGLQRQPATTGRSCWADRSSR